MSPAHDASHRPLTRKGLATRERIIDAATELIGRHGVAGTSTEQVRELAGVSGSQLYHYFDDKRALISAVITRQADAVAGHEAVELGALDSMEALRAWADAAVEHQSTNGGRGGCSLETLAGELSVADDQSRSEVGAGFLRWADVLRSGLEHMRERGELAPHADLDELSLVLLSALQGGAVMARTLGRVDPLRASMNAALAYVASFTA